MSQSRENLLTDGRTEGRTDSAYFTGPFRPSTNYDKKFSQFSVDDLKLKSTDGSFNSLPIGRSQAGQIIFLDNGESYRCPLYWNSSTIRRVVRSTIAVELLSLSDECDVSIYIIITIIIRKCKMAAKYIRYCL